MDKAYLVGEGLCQFKSDYETVGFFYGLFLATKMKYCLTIDNYGFTQEHKSFEVFKDSNQLLDRSQKCKMIKGRKTSALLPKSCKKTFVGRYLRKKGFVMNVMIKKCARNVIFESMKKKSSKLF